MGQNFLAEPAVAAHVVEKATLEMHDTVVEIGAGLGALTIPLALKVKHVYAVEPDTRISGVLRNELVSAGVSNVTIVEEDILQCDVEAILGSANCPFKVAGNLPYHLSSPVLLYLVGRRGLVRSATLMFQKEVADRLVAKPGTKAYGRLSVLIQYCAHIDPVVHVPATCFYPKPRVDSTVVNIAFFQSPPFPATDESFFFRMVRAAFSKRRKMLKNALLNSDLDRTGRLILSAFEKAGIDPKRRAETLSVEEFVRLSNHLER